MRKPVFGVSDKVKYNRAVLPQRLEISDLGSRGTAIYLYVAKIKVLISCAVTAQLICAFVFA